MSEDQEVRRRPLHEEKGEEGSGEGERDPFVQEGGDEGDKWDLDDDGNWGPDKSDEDTPASRRRKILRRSTTETAMAFVCHTALMCFYIYAHVYDGTIFKRNKGKGFEGAAEYGGRWKYLSYINFWLQLGYFFLCFFTDIMPYGEMKVRFKKLCDFVFTTAAFPMAIFVFTAFWGIYVIDRELIYPAALDKFIPVLLNHFWHTAVVVCVFIELLVVFHRYPSNFVAIATLLLISTAYIVWTLWILTVSSRWVYPFLKFMPPPFIALFFSVAIFFNFGFYFAGKWLGYLRWRARHELMDELEL